MPPEGDRSLTPISRSGRLDVLRAPSDHTEPRLARQTQRISARMKPPQAARYCASAQRVSAFTGGRSASPGRLTR
jgi:hypothetical protein